MDSQGSDSSVCADVCGQFVGQYIAFEVSMPWCPAYDDLLLGNVSGAQNRIKRYNDRIFALFERF